MSESTHRKSALVSTVCYPMTRVSMGARCVALCAVLVFANLPAIAFAQSSCPGIQVKIPNIKNSTGNIACGIFETPEGFPNKFFWVADLLKRPQHVVEIDKPYPWTSGEFFA